VKCGSYQWLPNRDCLSYSAHQIGPSAPSAARGSAGGMPDIMRQTEAALGLWQRLKETAVTPSTVLPPLSSGLAVGSSSSRTTNQSNA
jgi:hypothetical protein